jgi:hypothetical protein
MPEPGGGGATQGGSVTRESTGAPGREVDALQAFRETSPVAGDEFPDETLPLLGGGEVRLSALRGRPVVLEVGSFT